ncbi:MAG: hypothetical protein VX335_03540 [Pseudomonadota bacterium]|nr:hypothetical protein [Pseudomonadota bacterium]
MSEKFRHFTTEMQKYQITESELSQALNHDIKTVDRKRSGWLVFLIIAVANGLTTGFLGFPDIGSIASVDNITNLSSGFSITDKVFMMAGTTLMMLPFFKQLFSAKVNEKVNIDNSSKRNEIIEDAESNASSIRGKLKNSPTLFLIDALGIALICGIFGATISLLINHGAIILPIMIMSQIVSIILYTNTKTFVRSILKNSLASEHKINKNIKSNDSEHENNHSILKRYLLNIKINSYKSSFKTKKIIRESIEELKILQFTQPSKIEIENSLFNSIYNKQISRYRSSIILGASDITLNQMQIAHMHSRISDKNHALSKLYQKLSGIDKVVEKSPLVRFQQVLHKEGNSDDLKEVLRVVSAFRAYLIDENIIINQNYNESVSELLKKLDLKVDENNKFIKDAILAEISEEKQILDLSLSDAQNFTAMQTRFEERNELELETLLKLENRGNNGIFAIIGNVIGTLNALVNGAITAAVIGKLIITLIPIIFGVSISSPLAIYAILGISCIAGFVSSFNITRKSIIKVFAKNDKDLISREILTKSKIKQNNIYLKLAITIGAIGLGVLSGLQVYSILTAYLASVAFYSAIVVGVTTVFAVYSLFSDYAINSIAKSKAKENFVATYFKNESKKMQSMSNIYMLEFILSLTLGVAVAIGVWAVFPHIVVVSMLGIATTFFSWQLIALTSNDHYKKEKILKLNFISKAGICITLLYTMCLMISVSCGIFSLGIFSINSINLLFSIGVGIIVASLYFPFVWNTATSPELNFTHSILKLDKDMSIVKQSFLEKNCSVIMFLFSLILFSAVTFSVSFFIPNIIGILTGSALGLTITFFFTRSYLKNIINLTPENNGDKSITCEKNEEQLTPNLDGLKNVRSDSVYSIKTDTKEIERLRLNESPNGVSDTTILEIVKN